MIFDKISNSKSYVITHPLFEKAFAFLDIYLKNPVEAGTYEICGQDLFVKVQNYETRDEGFLEIHDKYIDIHCMVEGVEKVYYRECQGLESELPYNEEDDVQFLKDVDGGLEFLLKAGEFAIFLPQDAHKPAMNVAGKAKAKKLVFKVRVEV